MKFEVGDIKIEAQSLIIYCNALLPLLHKNKYAITCIQTESSSFGARIYTTNGTDFTLSVNSGTITTFIDVINKMDDKDIDEEVDGLAITLLNNKDYRNDIYKSIAYCATIFIVFHEISHLMRRHLHHIISKASVNEDFTAPIPEKRDAIDEHFHNLVELDADAYAIILLTTLSTELFSATSEYFDIVHPAWRDAADNPQHRLASNQIMLWASSLALAAIETHQNPSKKHPSPFIRIINIYDAYNQQIYKAYNITDPNDTSGDIEYIKMSDNLKSIMTNIVYPAFLNSVDVIYNTCRLMNCDLSEKYNLTIHTLAQNLLSDFTKLLLGLDPTDLKTKEAHEFKKLRLYRPDFNNRFPYFLDTPDDM